MIYLRSKKPRIAVLVADFYRTFRNLGMTVDLDYPTPFGKLDLVTVGPENNILFGIYV